MRRNLAGGGQAGLGDLELLPTHLQHRDVVQRLAVRGVHRHGHLEGLVGEAQVAQRNTDMANVVPTKPVHTQEEQMKIPSIHTS